MNFFNSHKVLIGSFIFISLYTGALFAFAINVAPGTVLDPAGLPGSYTVHVLGFDEDGFLNTDAIPLANSSESQFYIGDDFTIAGGTSGVALSYKRGTEFNGMLAGDLTNGGIGDQTTWAGYLDPGVMENSFRATPTYSGIFSTDDATSDSSFLIAQPTVIGMSSNNGAVNAALNISLDDGIVLIGKDDLTTSVLANFENDSGDELMQIKNDGTFTQTHGNYEIVNKDTAYLGIMPAVGTQYENGNDYFFNGVVDASGFGSTMFSSIAYRNASTTKSNFVIAGASSVNIGFSNQSTGKGVTADFSETNGAVFRGKDDLSTTQGFLIENDSGDDLLQIMNNGYLTANYTNINGTFTSGNFSFTHPVFGPIDMSGSLLTLSATETFDNGVFDAGGGFASGQHYINTVTNEYIGFDVTDNDSSLFNFNTVTGAAVAVTVANNDLALLASPDGSNVNRIKINNDTTGIVFTGLDDLAASTLVNFENDSGTDLVTISNVGNFGIGDVTPDFALDVEDSSPTYIASIFNDGNLLTRRGLWIQAGLDDQSQAGPNILIGFGDGDGTAVGSITFGSSATAYNTSSDQRLKENIVDTALSIDMLNQIKIRDFTWIADEQHTLAHGVIAQELYEVYPGAVTKPEDESVDTWMVDYSKLMPLAVKSIQDLGIKIKPIEDLTTENNSFAQVLRSWFESATNGIGDFFANRVRTKTICLADDDGNETCLSKSDIDTLISSGGENNNTPPSNGSGGGSNQTDTTAPVITLLGEQSVSLTVSDTFTDPGATAIDETDGDISAQISVSGIVDTATVGIYTLTYSVSDVAGNNAEVVRTVVINETTPVE